MSERDSQPPFSPTETEGLDRHTPPDFAAWLRKRAEENRRVAELPPSKWPQRPELLKHLAFRFEQGAEIVETLEREREHWLGEAQRYLRHGQEMLGANERMRAALESLLPGLILDLRYANVDDDKDAMRSRIETVRSALAADSPADVPEKRTAYVVGNPCGVCASGIISSRGGHLVCANCGWYPPGSWTQNTPKGG